MQNGFLILSAILAFGVNTIMTRIFQLKIQNSEHSINLYQAFFALVSSSSYFIFSGINNIPFSPHILLPASLLGVSYAFAVLFSAKCMQLGYMSLTSVITNLSLILPVAFSWIVLGESVELNAVIGLVLIIVTLILSSLSADNNENGNIKKWLFFVAIAFLANGNSAIVQKQYKEVFGENDLMLFMGFAHLVSTLVFAVAYIAKNRKSNLSFKNQFKKPVLLPAIAIISGLGSFAGNGLLGYLCDKVNGGLLYPLLNGGLCILMAITSFVFFKEKLSNRKILAIFTGIVAIVMLNL